VFRSRLSEPISTAASVQLFATFVFLFSAPLREKLFLAEAQRKERPKTPSRSNFRMMRAKLNSSSLVAFFLGLLFLSAMPAQWPAVRIAHDSQSAASAKVARIPFELNGNHIYFKGLEIETNLTWAG
jgi:hypothetical protein